MSGDPAGRDIYFEFTVVGAAVRVAAIDSATGIEVTVMGPATAARSDLERLALQKLKARLARDQK
jgi:uncharacterized protein DUF6898